MAHCSRCRQDKPMEDFPPSKAHHAGQWCRLCLRESARRRIGAVERDVVCGHCGRPFRSAFRKATYCSRECKDRADTAADAAAREASKPVRKCVYCGKFMPKKMRADARYCSEKCNAAAHKLKRGHGRLGPGRRRDIERAYIIERDGSRCHLCGLVCQPHEISLDHVIPLSVGGDHSPENLRVAHLSCNASKGARAVGEQILLVG